MKSEKIRQDRKSSDLLDSPQYLKDQIVTSPPAVVFTEDTFLLYNNKL